MLPIASMSRAVQLPILLVPRYRYMTDAAPMLVAITARCKSVVRHFVAWILIAGGVGWLAYLTRLFIELIFDLVPSADVALTYFLPFASGTGFVALLAIATGFRFAKGNLKTT